MRLDVLPTRFRSVRAAIAVAVAATASLAVGCGDSTSADQTNAEFGHYTLVTVNGQTLPYTMTNTALGTVVIQNASIDLTSRSPAPGYSAVVNGTLNGQGPLRILSDSGTYARNGGTVTFSSQTVTGLTYPGTLNGSALSISVPGLAVGTTGTIVLGMQKS